MLPPPLVAIARGELAKFQVFPSWVCRHRMSVQRCVAAYLSLSLVNPFVGSAFPACCGRRL